jgi:serine/threonine protein kinase
MQPMGISSTTIMKSGRKESKTSHAISVHDTPSSPYPGKGFQIAEFTLIETLGHGSMATVFLAQDQTGHEVAIKIFQEGPGVSATMLERFRREAEASKKLRRHPNIMKIYATGQEGPYHFIAMECIKRSNTLENALENSSLSLTAIVHLCIKIARALQYAHSHRIVHRDVKPTNIMINEFGEPLLADFGVAELIDLPSCTLTGALTGTPLYMSPEQARGERVGPASDIYSLGVVLYEALTSVLPYNLQHFSPVKQVIEAVKNEEARRPRLFRKEISPDLEAVILKALEKDPRDRYMDAEAFAVDLERALAGRRVSAHRFSPLDHARHLVRFYRKPLTVGLLLLLVALTSGTLFRQKLLEERYQGVLRKAQLKNMEYLLQQAGGSPEPAGQTPRAWHEIRLARRAMTAGNWMEASASFQTAIDLSETVRDRRTAAIAQLDQARCEALMHHYDQAREIYRQILENADAPPSVTDMAQMEYLLLALLNQDQAGAVNIGQSLKIPSHGPLREAILCLQGKQPAEALLEKVGGLPPRFQNDACLAAAVRFHHDGESKRAQAALKRCIQNSMPPSEWPAPFARILYSRFSVD